MDSALPKKNPALIRCNGVYPATINVPCTPPNTPEDKPEKKPDKKAESEFVFTTIIKPK